jgi:hypothetical protein
MTARKGEPQEIVRVIFANGATGAVSAEQARRCSYRPASPAVPGNKPALPRPTPAELRAWASENGVDCPAKGRIPERVYEAYQAASE